MITDAQKWLILISVLLGGWILYRLAPILAPFLIGMLLAYLGDPAVNKLEAAGLSRALAVIAIFALMTFIALSVLVVVLPLLQDQIGRLIIRIPDVIDFVQSKADSIASLVGVDISAIDPNALKQAVMSHWQSLGHIMGKLLGRVSQSGRVFLLWISYLVIIPVVAFYLLRDWNKLLGRIGELIPKKYQALIARLAGECDAVLAEFLRGQLLIMLVQGVIYSTGLWIVGLEFALLIGILAGLVSFVPYLGFVIGFSAAATAAFFQFYDFIPILYVLLVFGLGQAIEGMLLTPLLIGDRIGIHPVAVIFAVMAGGQLFGFFGVLLALPVAAVLTVLLRHAHQRYLASSLYAE